MTLVLESQLILFAETKQTTGWNILGERYEMRGICYIYLYNNTRVESFKTTNKIYWNLVAFQHSSESPY